MYLALKRAGVPAELHIYATATHDFGVRKSDHPCSPGRSLVPTAEPPGFLKPIAKNSQPQRGCIAVCRSPAINLAHDAQRAVIVTFVSANAKSETRLAASLRVRELRRSTPGFLPATLQCDSVTVNPRQSCPS